MPPAPVALLCSSIAWRSASLTAARTMSWSISTSSGSTASGSIASDLSSMSPVITTLTMPPPADASIRSSLSFSCAAIMSSCIFCACWSRAPRLGGWGIRTPLRLEAPRRRTLA